MSKTMLNEDYLPTIHFWIMNKKVWALRKIKNIKTIYGGEIPYMYCICPEPGVKSITFRIPKKIFIKLKNEYPELPILD